MAGETLSLQCLQQMRKEVIQDMDDFIARPSSSDKLTVLNSLRDRLIEVNNQLMACYNSVHH
jgi:hypothetical protein